MFHTFILFALAAMLSLVGMEHSPMRWAARAPPAPGVWRLVERCGPQATGAWPWH